MNDSEIDARRVGIKRPTSKLSFVNMECGGTDIDGLDILSRGTTTTTTTTTTRDTARVKKMVGSKL